VSGTPVTHAAPDPLGAPATRALLADAAERATRYLAGLDARPVAPDAAATAALAALDLPFPDAGLAPAEVLRELDERGSAATMAMAGSRFFGFVIGGALPASLAANWLAGAWDQNAAYWETTPAAAAFEALALRWTLEALGLPPTSAGSFVTGATMANTVALAAARHAVLARVGWNVEADGLIGAPPVAVIVGGEVHPSVSKGLGLVGLGRSRVTRVPVDGQGRMRVDQLPPISGPTIICAQAGNVNTGAFDDVGALCARVTGTGAWVHVDGAFGLWAGASPALRHLVDGVAAADSWATDFHKWLNVPYDSGIALVRDGHALEAAMAITAEYLPQAKVHRNPSEFTPELSRRARGVDAWAALRSLGRAGLAALVERNCAHARRFAQGLEAAGFRVLNEVVLNQVLVTFGPPAETERVIAALKADGVAWAGVTVWQGQTAMRISVSGWNTTEADVERSLAAMVRAARGA
jgi:glutamate/tyrosine decarboxylase-like PLP-dependent enzyme